MGSMETFFKRADVQTALHLQKAGKSSFGYHQAGPASITLWPNLAKALRVLIYNGLPVFVFYFVVVGCCEHDYMITMDCDRGLGCVCSLQGK